MKGGTKKSEPSLKHWSVLAWVPPLEGKEANKSTRFPDFLTLNIYVSQGATNIEGG